ncbi:MAG: biotin/lipoate A/B protein ligase family protein [Promethearchaeota archaeon]
MKEKWRLIDLGKVDYLSSQTIYHAVALARSEGVVEDTILFCYPDRPFVCLGYHQDIEKEIRVDFCKKNNIPVVRRVIGGGTVLLDDGQFFFQIMVSRKNPKIPLTVAGAYKTLLEAPVLTYRDLGLHADYKPINDIEVDNKKISGNGAGLVEDTTVLTGNIILDFNFDLMTKIFKVPSEKFRDKITKSLRERLTTCKKELGDIPDRNLIKKLLIKNFEQTLNIQLVADELTERENELLQQLNKEYKTEEWMYAPSHRRPELYKKRKVKISGSVHIFETVYKSPGGLIRVTGELTDDEILTDLLVSGDFWFFPADSLQDLETALIGHRIKENELFERISHFYEEHNIESPGTSPEDLVKAIMLGTA